MSKDPKRREDISKILDSDRLYVTRDPSPSELEEVGQAELLAYMRVLRAELRAVREQVADLVALLKAMSWVVPEAGKGGV